MVVGKIKSIEEIKNDKFWESLSFIQIRYKNIQDPKPNKRYIKFRKKI